MAEGRSSDASAASPDAALASLDAAFFAVLAIVLSGEDVYKEEAGEQRSFISCVGSSFITQAMSLHDATPPKMILYVMKIFFYRSYVI